MYVTHTARNSESFPSLVLDSRSQLGCLLFPSHPLTLGVCIPHFCSTACSKLYPAPAHPRFRSCTTALCAHHPGSSTGTPPDADLRRRRHFCSLDLGASPSYSSHGPCAAPPTDRDFGTRPHAHCFYILDTSLYSTLILRPHSQSIDLAPHMHRARTSTSTVHLAHTIPTSALHTSHASPPLTRPCIRVGLLHRFGYPSLLLLVLDSGSSCSSTSALLPVFLSLAYSRMYPVYIAPIPSCRPLRAQSSSDSVTVSFTTP
jgi:hypothetical protein